MAYIVVHRDLSISIEPAAPARLASTRTSTISPLEKEFIFEPGFAFARNHVLYPLYYKSLPASNTTKAMLHPAPPWLVALILVMRDGVIQGLTWDVVKLAVAKAMAVLKDTNLGPRQPSRRTRGGVTDSTASKQRTQLGFSYVSYWESGQRRRELFVGVQRALKTTRKTGSLTPPNDGFTIDAVVRGTRRAT